MSFPPPPPPPLPLPAPPPASCFIGQARQRADAIARGLRGLGVGRRDSGTGHHPACIGHHPEGDGHHPPGNGHHPPGSDCQPCRSFDTCNAFPVPTYYFVSKYMSVGRRRVPTHLAFRKLAVYVCQSLLLWNYSSSKKSTSYGDQEINISGCFNVDGIAPFNLIAVPT
eukprot:SM000031S11523  [mRNA]  locus=s31:115174:115997:+ [translate_table: standard]